jgi:hypothetical protein
VNARREREKPQEISAIGLSRGQRRRLRVSSEAAMRLSPMDDGSGTAASPPLPAPVGKGGFDFAKVMLASMMK